MRFFIKFFFVSILSLGALVGTVVGYHIGRDVSFKRLYLGEQQTSLRNAVSTATALRRAGSSVYLAETDALILWHATDVSRYPLDTDARTSLQLARAYYDVFHLPVPAVLVASPAMPRAEFDRITGLDVAEIIRRNL